MNNNIIFGREPDCHTSEDKPPEFLKIRRLLSCARRAVDEYAMIEPGDRIAVGVSGGKDSLSLLCVMKDLQRFYPVPFEICAVSLSMGFEGMDFGVIEQFCAECNIPFRLVKTRLASVIFEERREKNPCSLCARMRRGILHDAALELGCNKVALGHHCDDLLETFMLNLIHEGRLAAFLPKTYLCRKKLTVIRPLIYAQEKDVRYFAAKNNLPVIKNPCPADSNTQREAVGELIYRLDREHKGFKHRMLGAIKKGGLLEGQTAEDDGISD